MPIIDGALTRKAHTRLGDVGVARLDNGNFVVYRTADPQQRIVIGTTYAEAETEIELLRVRPTPGL